MNKTNEGSILEEIPILDRLVDPSDVLIDNSARTEIHMTNLAVAHQAQRQPNLVTGRGEQRVRVAPEQLLEVMRLLSDRVVLTLGPVPPAVQNNEQ